MKKIPETAASVHLFLRCVPLAIRLSRQSKAVYAFLDSTHRAQRRQERGKRCRAAPGGNSLLSTPHGPVITLQVSISRQSRLTSHPCPQCLRAGREIGRRGG